MQLVEWSEYKDTDELPMVRIGGAHYTRTMALMIAEQIKELLNEED